jgi:hypothetical protein
MACRVEIPLKAEKIMKFEPQATQLLWNMKHVLSENKIKIKLNRLIFQVS